jgi:large subunit ribosomal protein L2
MVRSAGTKAQLNGSKMVIMLRFVCHQVKSDVSARKLLLPLVLLVMFNTKTSKIGSAGRNRRKSIRPGVRGVVMNAADHPHGGGDGGRHGTGKPPQTPWGQLTLGYRTRRRKDVSKLDY